MGLHRLARFSKQALQPVGDLTIALGRLRLGCRLRLPVLGLDRLAILPPSNGPEERGPPAVLQPACRSGTGGSIGIRRTVNYCS